MNHKTQLLAISLAIAAVCTTQPTLAQSGNGVIGAPLPFSTYDKDANGTVSEQEFDSVQAQQAGDRAAAGAPMGGTANTPTFATFDRDGDGRIAPTEFDTVQPPRTAGGPGTMGSGVKMGLSDGAGAGMKGSYPSFADLDENHDGSIAPSEFNDARANRMVEKSQEGQPIGSLRNAPPFGALDLNSDGGISAGEFNTVQAQHSQPLPTPR